ncbi:glycosyltransferase [Francisellaceae bacterium]|nr:glycosyltransferase [Francisellaceae bacterium]
MIESKTPQKKISIITVCLNASKQLEETIFSIQAQPYKNIEYIIIDGGSIDNTLDIIKKHERDIDYWVSEPDEGIYDAMNKGLKVATGAGVLFLNAGDYIVGTVPFGQIPIPGFLPVKYKNIFGKLKHCKLKSHKQGLPVCHQAIIFEKKPIFYRLDYRVAADYAFFLEFGYDKNLPVYKKKNTYIYYDNNGFSAINSVLRDREIASIIKKKFGFYYARKFQFKTACKYIIKKVIRSARGVNN